MTKQRQVRTVFSHPEVEVLRSVVPPTTAIAAYATRRDVATLNGLAPREVTSTYVDGPYFRMLGLQPIYGRFFTTEEATSAGPTWAAVISDRLWSECCHRSPSVLKRSIEVGAKRYTIIGVAPKSFLGVGLNATDVWLTFGTVGAGSAGDDPVNNVHDLRLKVLLRAPSAGAGQIAANRATEALRRLNVVGDGHASASLVPISRSLEADQDVGAVANARALFIATAIILLIACANVAGLLIVRSAQRRSEFAVRYALGAARWMLAAEAGAEGVAIAGGAGGLGLVAAALGGTVLRKALIPGIMWAPDSVDPRLAMVVASAALICGLLIAALPVAYVMQLDLAKPQIAAQWTGVSPNSGDTLVKHEDRPRGAAAGTAAGTDSRGPRRRASWGFRGSETWRQRCSPGTGLPGAHRAGRPRSNAFPVPRVYSPAPCDPTPPLHPGPESAGE